MVLACDGPGGAVCWTVPGGAVCLILLGGCPLPRGAHGWATVLCNLCPPGIAGPRMASGADGNSWLKLETAREGRAGSPFGGTTDAGRLADGGNSCAHYELIKTTVNGVGQWGAPWSETPWLLGRRPRAG